MDAMPFLFRNQDHPKGAYIVVWSPLTSWVYAHLEWMENGDLPPDCMTPSVDIAIRMEHYQSLDDAMVAIRDWYREGEANPPHKGSVSHKVTNPQPAPKPPERANPTNAYQLTIWFDKGQQHLHYEASSANQALDIVEEMDADFTYEIRSRAGAKLVSRGFSKKATPAT